MLQAAPCVSAGALGGLPPLQSAVYALLDSAFAFTQLLHNLLNT